MTFPSPLRVTYLQPKDSGTCIQHSDEKFVLFTLSQQFGIQQHCHYISIGSPLPWDTDVQRD